MDRFSENLSRLIGLHGLPAKEAATMMNMSQSAFTKWATGKRNPSFPTALKVGEFFGVPADRLARAAFEELLANELASADRFREVEAEILRRRAQLRQIESEPPSAMPRKVLAMDQAAEAQRLRRKGFSEDEVAAALARRRKEANLSVMQSDETNEEGVP